MKAQVFIDPVVMSTEPSPLATFAIIGGIYLCIFLFALVTAPCYVFCTCPSQTGDVADPPDHAQVIVDFEEDSGIEDAWSACDSMDITDE